MRLDDCVYSTILASAASGASNKGNFIFRYAPAYNTCTPYKQPVPSEDFICASVCSREFVSISTPYPSLYLLRFLRVVGLSSAWPVPVAFLEDVPSCKLRYQGPRGAWVLQTTTPTRVLVGARALFHVVAKVLRMPTPIVTDGGGPTFAAPSRCRGTTKKPSNGNLQCFITNCSKIDDAGHGPSITRF